MGKPLPLPFRLRKAPRRLYRRRRGSSCPGGRLAAPNERSSPPEGLVLGRSVKCGRRVGVVQNAARNLIGVTYHRRRFVHRVVLCGTLPIKFASEQCRYRLCDPACSRDDRHHLRRALPRHINPPRPGRDHRFRGARISVDRGVTVPYFSSLTPSSPTPVHAFLVFLRGVFQLGTFNVSTTFFFCCFLLRPVSIL